MSAENRPADLAAIQADDELLDMLSTADRTQHSELARLLAAWRREVRTDSDLPLVDTERATAAIAAGRQLVYGERAP